MDLSGVLQMLGGVGLFLFGMSMMGDGLKRAAGNKMEMILWRLSSTPIRGVLLGLLAGVSLAAYPFCQKQIQSHVLLLYGLAILPVPFQNKFNEFKCLPSIETAQFYHVTLVVLLLLH